MYQLFIPQRVVDFYGLPLGSTMTLKLMSDYVFENKKCKKSRTGKLSETKISDVLKTFEGVIVCRPVPMKIPKYAKTTNRTIKSLI